jgi:hypothetical protein
MQDDKVRLVSRSVLEQLLKIQEKSTKYIQINLWSELSQMSQIIENIEQQQE